MNTKFLTLTSFLTALLLHLFVFNFCTVVFPVSPEAFKPKFSFLGPILKQSDLKNFVPMQAASGTAVFDRKNSVKNHTDSVAYGITNPDKNPFTIGAIRKPITPETVQSEEKTVLKSTFDAPAHSILNEKIKTDSRTQELKIYPYQPLKLGTPKHETPNI